MANFQINAGHVSRPRVVGRGNVLNIRPGAGATAIVEYTTGSTADIANNAAVWRSWPKGIVSVATSDQMNNDGFIRVTARNGNVSYEIEEQVSGANASTYRTDWQSSVGASGAPTLSGQFVVGGKVKAQMPPGVFATLQFTRTLKAAPYTKANIAGAVATAVNSLEYTILSGDATYSIGCDASAQVASSVNGEVYIPPASGPAVITALSSMSTFGDSLMALGDPVTTGSNPAIGGEKSVSVIGWANDTLRLNGPGLDAISRRAVGGTTAQQHLSTQLPLVLADVGDGAWYHGGVNSYNDALSTPLGGPYTMAQNITAVTSIINQLSAAKKWVIVDSINPVSQSGSTGAKGRAGEFIAHNAAIKALCESLPNVIYNDEYAIEVDPASGVFNPLPNLILNSDGIHRTTFGARFCGENVIPKITSRLSLSKYLTAGANLLPPFTGTGGTATPGTGVINGIGALPANWNCFIASGSATVTLSNPVPGTVRMTVSNPGGAASTIQLLSQNGAALLAAISTGDVIQGGADYATVGTSTNLTRVAASIRANGSTGNLWDGMGRDTAAEPAGDFKYNQTPSSGRRWIQPWNILFALSQIEFILAINVDPAGSAVVDFSLPTLFKLT